MQSSYNKEFNIAFLLEEDDLKEINKLLTNRIGETRIEARCIHDTTLKMNSVGELLNYGNAKSKRIIGITFYAVDHEKEKAAYVRFGGGKSSTISVTVEARSDVVEKLSSELRDIILGTKCWYNGIDSIEKFFFFLLPIISFFAISSTFDFWSSYYQSEGKVYSFTNSVILVFVVMLLSLLVMSFAFFLIIYCFPRRYYLIGQAKKRHKNLAMVQGVVVLGFFVSLAAGIAGSLLMLPLIK